MILHRGPHQCSLAVPLLRGIHLPAVREQRADALGIAGPRRRHEHGLARAEGRVRVTAGVEHCRQHLRVGDRGGFVQWRHAEAIREIRIGVGFQQQLHGFEIVRVRGPVQRRGRLRVERVDGYAFGDEASRFRKIVRADRSDEPRVVGCRSQSGSHGCGRGKPSECHEFDHGAQASVTSPLLAHCATP